MNISALSYREAQKLCKEHGLPAKGKLEELQARLSTKLSGGENRMSEPENGIRSDASRAPLEPFTPPPPQQRLPQPATRTPELLVDSGKRTQAKARAAIALANLSPLPAFAPSSPDQLLPAVAASAPEVEPASPPTPVSHWQPPAQEAPSTMARTTSCSHGKAASGRIPGVVFVSWFLALTMVLAFVSSFFARMDRTLVWQGLRAGKPDHLLSELQRLYEHDRAHAQAFVVQHYTTLQHEADLTLRHITHTTRSLALHADAKFNELAAITHKEYLLHLDALKSLLAPAPTPPPSPSDAAAPPATAALSATVLRAMLDTARASGHPGIKELAASLLSEADARAEVAKAFSVLVPYTAQDGVDAALVAAEVADVLGCADSLAGRCRLIDGSSFTGRGADTAGDLQHRLAEQLRAEPSSVVIISSLQTMDASALNVLIDAMGENGGLEGVGGRVDTSSAVILLLQPALADAPHKAFHDLLETMTADSESPEGTLASMTRRVCKGYLPFVSIKHQVNEAVDVD